MPDTRYLLWLVLVSAAITWGLRAVPFAVLAPMRRGAVIGRLALSPPASTAAAVRSVPLLTDRCGTRVARPANDVDSGWQRWARPGQATPASSSEYIASACERPVRPDSSDGSGPGTWSNRQGPRTGVDLTGGER